MSEHTEATLDRLHADMTHLASALRKRGPEYEEHAESLQWCADQLAKVKEARK